MRYTIENQDLSVSIESLGAEIVSVISKKSGTECIWQADPDIWGRHAPILFPYTGLLANGEFHAKGKTYKGTQHGFARDMEHILINQSDNELIFELHSNDDSLSLFPYEFVLTSVFKIDGNRLNHTIIVKNPGSENLSFGLGYHPGFNCPFDSYHDTSDYELRFDKKESPVVIECTPKGVSHKWEYSLGKNTDTIQLTDKLFENDSFCMSNLRSNTLGIYEKTSDRSIVCNISGFPYTLIWSSNTKKLKFVCIEPWHSIPDEAGDPSNWEEKPAAAVLAPNESFLSNFEMTFNL